MTTLTETVLTAAQRERIEGSALRIRDYATRALDGELSADYALSAIAQAAENLAAVVAETEPRS